MSGVSGREARGSGGRWRPYPLAGFTAGEVVRRQRAPVPTGSGEQGRGEGGGGLGRGRGGAAQFGPGGAVGGTVLFPFFFPVCGLFSVFFLFVYFLFCFISFKSI